MNEKSKKEKKDLTVSQVDRQNILNNPYALQEIEKAAQIQGIPFEGKRVLTKEQVAAFFDVTPRTIDNHIERNGEELRQNGYEVLRGKRLKSLKLEISKQGANETDFVTKTTVLGIFDFRAFLNVGMLIGESERARLPICVRARTGRDGRRSAAMERNEHVTRFLHIGDWQLGMTRHFFSEGV